MTSPPPVWWGVGGPGDVGDEPEYDGPPQTPRRRALPALPRPRRTAKRAVVDEYATASAELPG